MCGIWSYLQMNNRIDSPLISIKDMFKLFMSISHRGPDTSLFQKYTNDLYIGFHRLEIMDPTFHSNQPYVLFDNDDASTTIIFMCNGEIYNYQELIQKYDLDITTHSDCLTIPKLYLKSGCDYEQFKKYFLSEISGEFSFVLYELDRNKKVRKLIYGRDKIGVRPLYVCEMKNDDIVFSSEVKGLNHELLSDCKEVVPGMINCLEVSVDGIVTSRKHFDLNSFLATASSPSECGDKVEENLVFVKNSIIDAVKRRMTADQPIGFLLSGGVDSSLVAAIAAANSKSKIKTFCCGLAGGTDLEYARQVAAHIGSEHTEVVFTEKEALGCLSDVVYTTETWDTTTIRASVGQYLVSKYISENTNIKVLLVGEGPDEVCSSYLFNYYAPSPEALHETAKEYVKNIHLYDCRRVDRCSSRWGLECRVPLLDPEFIQAYWTVPAAKRHPKHGGIEKYVFRSLFADDNLLPEAVLWRKKEAFSDGISEKTNSWFRILQTHISETQESMSEADYYRKLFTDVFQPAFTNIIPKYWQPKWIDDKGTVPEDYVDPSARVLAVYQCT